MRKPLPERLSRYTEGTYYPPFMAYEMITHDAIPHYYGNYVRMLFFGTVILSFVGIPLWGHLVPFGTMFEVLGGIALVALAGLTNPHGRLILVVNIFASGIGAFLLEYSAISFQKVDSTPLLLARELGAVMLIAALYFSVKTLRAKAQGKIGVLPTPWEFEDAGKAHDE